MATVQPLPPPPAPAPKLEISPEEAAERALVPAAHAAAEGAGMALTAAMGRMPVELDVAIPVRDFRVRHLLTLEPGQVIETQWAHGEDMPLAAGAVLLAWSEFEVVDSQLAVRVTRMA